MKLLMLAPRFPYPPTRGDCVRAWGELELLSESHDVWLACIDRSAPAPEHLAHVQRRCRGVTVAVRGGLMSMLCGGASLLRGGSLSAGYFGDAGLGQVVRRWSETVGFDAVLTVSSAMAPYAEKAGDARRVLDMNDVDSWKWNHFARLRKAPLSWLYKLEARRLAALEERALAGSDVCLVVNERERRKLVERGHASRVVVSRTGVDLEYYGAVVDRTARAPQRADLTIGMLGSMFYGPNVRAVSWFGKRVWPLVKRDVPRARWLIVGNRPTRTVRRWGRAEGVTVTGFVPDVRPYLRETDVFVNAVHEEIGVQTKLIEALAAGKAAVVTPQAAAGIDYAGDPPFVVAETPAEFAQAVRRLLHDGELAWELGLRARSAAVAKYRARDQVAQIERFLRPHRASTVLQQATADRAHGAALPAVMPQVDEQKAVRA